MATPLDHDPLLRQFQREIEGPESGIVLDRAHLALGLFAYPNTNMDASLHQLDRLARGALERFGADQIGAADLAGYLFREQAFTGNSVEPADPRNSYLNEVLERRLGIPITLSILYLEVARRLGLSAEGVGLPGHFIVRASGAGDAEPVLLDPFQGGVTLSVSDCAARLSAISAGRLAFRPSFLEPVGNRYILTRVLNNLKNAYGARNDRRNAAHVVERLLAINPLDAAEWRNLGLLLAGIGERRRAVMAFERYVTIAPPSEHTRAAREFAETLALEIARLN